MMENPRNSYLTSQYQRQRYVHSKVSHLYSKFQALFQLPRINALEECPPVEQQSQSSIQPVSQADASQECLPADEEKTQAQPVSPADALAAAAEELRKKVIQNRSNISEIEIQEYLASETGSDRLKRMYSKDIDGFRSPELWFIGESLIKIFGMTFLITSFFGGKHGGDKFVKNNQATAFRTRFQASRLMTDQVVLAGMKSGLMWGYRACVFSSIFLLLSQSIAVYRNKSSVLEYVIASGVTGSFLKANLGPKGMVSGGVFGSIMGLFGGTFIYGFMVLTNETQEQRHYWDIQKYLEVQRELQTGQD